MSQPGTEHDLLLAASCITPFGTDGALNEGALRRQLNRFVDAGLAVWLASSGTAEANVLTDEEIDQIAEIAVSEIGGRAPVFAMGREPRSAGEALDFARRMLDRGVDAVQVGPLDPGHSYLPTESELRGFYEAVIGSIDGSCVVATHMSVGYEVPAALLVDIVGGYEQVIGINVTHLRNYVYAPQVLALANGVSPVYLGSPVGATDGLILGASGVVELVRHQCRAAAVPGFRGRVGKTRSRCSDRCGLVDHDVVLDDPRCGRADRGQGDPRPLGRRSRSAATAPPAARRRGVHEGRGNHRTLQPAAVKETSMVEFRSRYGPVALVTGAAGWYRRRVSCAS